jgi:hypothetical protein
MFQKSVFAIVLALAISGRAVAAQKCTNIDATWTLYSTFVDGATATRIYSDGAPYDGTVNSCSTFDAVLNIYSNSRRVVMFNFAGSLLGFSYSAPPAWTGAPFAAGAGKKCGGSPCLTLNIRNILDSGAAPRSQYYVLYTRLTTALQAPDGNNYHLRMENPNTPNIWPNDPTANSPYLNARVIAEHYPATVSQKEYWLVYPEQPTSTNSLSPSPENGVLLSSDSTVNFGQYSMPFFIKISAK